ncbi:MAG: cysteine-rich CWC family protein [Aquabacterium sp.]|uniref:cysteine-rich CWC family protein n=1 Tax=Aquabacterium sp. TaxID=1872578 RepID=UPI003BD22B87
MSSSPQALPNHACPICGGPNACTPASCGDLSQPCWCRTVHFPPSLLDRVPPSQEGQACICQACVREADDVSQPKPGS